MINPNYFREAVQMIKDQERALEPPDDVIDYQREDEQIEQARADECDKIMSDLRKELIEIARSQK